MSEAINSTSNRVTSKAINRVLEVLPFDATITIREAREASGCTTTEFSAVKTYLEERGLLLGKSFAGKESMELRIQREPLPFNQRKRRRTKAGRAKMAELAKGCNGSDPDAGTGLDVEDVIRVATALSNEIDALAELEHETEVCRRRVDQLKAELLSFTHGRGQT